MNDLTGAIPVPKHTKIAAYDLSGNGIAPADNLQTSSSLFGCKPFK